MRVVGREACLIGGGEGGKRLESNETRVFGRVWGVRRKGVRLLEYSEREGIGLLREVREGRRVDLLLRSHHGSINIQLVYYSSDSKD